MGISWRATRSRSSVTVLAISWNGTPIGHGKPENCDLSACQRRPINGGKVRLNHDLKALTKRSYNIRERADNSRAIAGRTYQGSAAKKIDCKYTRKRRLELKDQRMDRAVESVHAYPDFHDHLRALDEAGLLVTIDRPINKDTEMHPLVRWQFRGGIAEADRKAFLFTNVVDAKGRKFDMPVVIGALASNPRIYGIGMAAASSPCNFANCSANGAADFSAAARSACIISNDLVC